MTVRPVEQRDAAAWLRLRRALFGDTEEAHARDVEAFLAGTASEPQAVVVAEAGGRLVGLVELSIRPHAEGCTSSGVGYVEGWYVEPGARGTGVGRALVDAAQRWAAAQGCSELASDSDLGNEVSRRAHVACGFEEVRQVRCYRKALPAAGKPRD